MNLIMQLDVGCVDYQITPLYETNQFVPIYFVFLSHLLFQFTPFLDGKWQKTSPLTYKSMHCASLCSNSKATKY